MLSSLHAGDALPESATRGQWRVKKPVAWGSPHTCFASGTPKRSTAASGRSPVTVQQLCFLPSAETSPRIPTGPRTDKEKGKPKSFYLSQQEQPEQSIIHRAPEGEICRGKQPEQLPRQRMQDQGWWHAPSAWSPSHGGGSLQAL